MFNPMQPGALAGFVVTYLIFCRLLLSLLWLLLKVGRDAVIDVECDRDPVEKRKMSRSTH